MSKWLKKTHKRLFEYVSGKMEISRGKIYEYLGTTQDFWEPGQVNITLTPYIE